MYLSRIDNMYFSPKKRVF